MQILPATLADVPQLVQMARHYHQQTRFRSFDFNAAKLAQSLAAIVEHRTGSHCFFVAKRNDNSLVGGLIGCVETHMFSDQVVATLVHYDVDQASRMSGAGYRLLLAFRKWAENRGAVELNVGINSGVHLDKLDRFLRKLGFVITGGNYSMMLGA